jgi:transposase InsO family protein
MATSHFNLKISRLRRDNGTEYTSNEFETFCKTKGIINESTIPYTPEQNGISERMNRTLVEL